MSEEEYRDHSAEEPVKEHPEPNRGGLLARRAVLGGFVRGAFVAAVGAAGFHGGRKWGQGEQADQDAFEKRVLVDRVVGQVGPKLIAEQDIVNDGRFMEISPGGEFSIPGDSDMPDFILDAGAPIVPVRAKPVDEVLDGLRNKDVVSYQTMTIVSNPKPEGAEASFIFEVPLSKMTRGAIVLELNEKDTVYVYPKTKEEIKFKLLSVAGVEKDDGNTSRVLVLSGEKEFPPGTSAYVIINEKGKNTTPPPSIPPSPQSSQSGVV